jgi:hypothetical protein
MAINLRERFGPKVMQALPLQADDFEFRPGDHASMHEFRIEHEEVSLLEKPLAVERRYFMSHGSDTLRIEFALCLEGFAAALELLFQRAGAFQREPADNAVVDLSRDYSIGDAGLAWAWGADERDGVAGFVRRNVLVFMQGRHSLLIDHASALDAALSRLGSTPSYDDGRAVFFDVAGGERALTVAPGGRIDLGVPVPSGAQYFFTASGGSVNRDPAEPGRFYFRAGLDKGNHRVSAFLVGRGLLPARQTIPITIS